MPQLTRRLQVLIDDDRYERLRREAERTGAPIGAIVRSAIDERVGSDSGRAERRAAADRILNAPRPPGREPDWEEQKEQMLDEMFKADEL
jgi:Ribbon-helix-helix protein, copG family